jgi:hypothetical protein
MNIYNLEQAVIDLRAKWNELTDCEKMSCDNCRYEKECDTFCSGLGTVRLAIDKLKGYK